MEPGITWYEVLGVLPGVQPEKIRQKYDERTHLLRSEMIAGAPSDVLRAVDRARNFLDTAWEILGDPASRNRYDQAAGYTYPQAYIDYFGPGYRPPAYLEREAAAARKHRWYMTSRLVTINDIYSFDPDVTVEFDDFEDVVGRNFRQPAEGLGFDGSPVAHMWRTMIWPNNFL